MATFGNKLANASRNFLITDKKTSLLILKYKCAVVSEGFTDILFYFYTFIVSNEYFVHFSVSIKKFVDYLKANVVLCQSIKISKGS